MLLTILKLIKNYLSCYVIFKNNQCPMINMRSKFILGATGKGRRYVDTAALTSWHGARPTSLSKFGKRERCSFYISSLSASHIQILKRSIIVHVPFTSPFKKLHNEERFIHFKMLPVHKVKPAWILLVYITPLFLQAL